MTDDNLICGENFDHDFPEPEYVDGFAVLICRRCGGEIFEDET